MGRMPVTWPNARGAVQAGWMDMHVGFEPHDRSFSLHTDSAKIYIPEDVFHLLVAAVDEAQELWGWERE
ncbi:hypothetical protein CWC39_00670 [Corynebacterium heidelbergense]|uniref:Uncharacterized protein n=1 Tax=Corynebacterium heidelbergense TaxID=2055947 RepID=A0A364VE07_9CORY|nr:hypothetical protein CWC39_00670 [Corynebacterium heidelbergense]